jgi:anti-anti-sigma factor
MTHPTVEITDRLISLGCMVLDIRADNFTYPDSGLLKGRVATHIDHKIHYIALNCTDIRLVDSYGLASIVSVQKLVKDHHGALALFGLNDIFNRLVELTHLDRILEIWASEAQAIYYLNSEQQQHLRHSGRKASV